MRHVDSLLCALKVPQRHQRLGDVRQELARRRSKLRLVAERHDELDVRVECWRDVDAEHVERVDDDLHRAERVVVDHVAEVEALLVREGLAVGERELLRAGTRVSVAHVPSVTTGGRKERTRAHLHDRALARLACAEEQQLDLPPHVLAVLRERLLDRRTVSSTRARVSDGASGEREEDDGASGEREEDDGRTCEPLLRDRRA